MNPLFIGLIFTSVLLALIALRVPMATAMIAAATGGIIVLQGWDAALFQVGATPFAVTEYGLSVVPLFILMAEIAARSGLARELYAAGAAFVGHWPGGLAIATLLGCAGFATISGSSLATAATIGGVALKEMDRFRYDRRLASGTVAAGGTIGILIPPSILMVIYGVMTEQSIGKLFAAGFLPGLMLTGLFIITVLVWVSLRPKAAPRSSRVPFRHRLIALKEVWAVVLIFLVVIGGIYGGLFTPTEAAGIGAAATLLAAAARRKMTFAVFRDSLLASAATSAMVFLIVIGSSLFSSFLTVTGMTTALKSLVSGTGISPLTVLIIVLLVYAVLGCFMESLGMVLLTVPVFYPILIQVGYDPIWFGIILVMVVELGLVTPPVGLNVYVVKGVAPHIPLGQIFIGIVPFIAAFALGMVLLIIWPGIALWLPRVLGP
jgi:tripartite ATP-independent transporter DctM subunit